LKNISNKYIKPKNEGPLNPGGRTGIVGRGNLSKYNGIEKFEKFRQNLIYRILWTKLYRFCDINQVQYHIKFHVFKLDSNF
jgi:hypothetical protein